MEQYCLPVCVPMFGGFGVSLRFGIWSFVLSAIFREEFSGGVSGAEILPPPPWEKKGFELPLEFCPNLFPVSCLAALLVSVTVFSRSPKSFPNRSSPTGCLLLHRAL